jgi:hypothetical protein
MPKIPQISHSTKNAYKVISTCAYLEFQRLLKSHQKGGRDMIMAMQTWINAMPFDLKLDLRRITY